MSEEINSTGEDRPARVMRNAGAILAARAIGNVFRLGAAFKAAAYLGSNAWGLFGRLISSLEIMRVLTNFGLDTVSIRTVALGRRSPSTVVANLLGIKTIMAAVGLLVVIALTMLLDRWGEQRWLLMALGLGLFPQAYASSLMVRFQASHTMERLVPVEAVTGGIYLGGVYLVALLGLGVGAVVGVHVTWEFLTVMLVALVWRLSWGGGLLSRGGGAPLWDRELAWRIFREGVPLGLLELIVMLYSRLGIFLLEEYGGLGAVGQYYTAFKVSEPLLAVAGAIAISALPVLSRLAEDRKLDELRGMFVRYSLRSAMLSCAVAGVVSLLSVWGLSLIKAEYSAAAPALQALVWATVFMFQNQLSSAVINAFGKFHYLTIFACLNLVVFTICGFTLVPRMGPTGAALSTLVTEGINCLVQLVTVTWLVRRAR